MRQRQRALALRWRYGLAVGNALETAAVVADALGAENLMQACRLALIAGQSSEPDLQAESCAALIVQSQSHDLREQLAPLHALLAWLLARSGNVTAALASVGRAELELERGELGACDVALRPVVGEGAAVRGPRRRRRAARAIGRGVADRARPGVGAP